MANGQCLNGYDANGNLGAKTDARGIKIAYQYDVLNRLLSKTYTDVSRYGGHWNAGAISLGDRAQRLHLFFGTEALCANGVLKPSWLGGDGYKARMHPIPGLGKTTVHSSPD